MSEPRTAARLSKPSTGHNSLYGPAICLCRDCSREVLALRCPVMLREGDDSLTRCGRYKHRGRAHTLLPATIWRLAEERSHDPY